MTRFTQTDKWSDPWFQKLRGAYKLIFIYVVEKCNNAGFWEINEDLLRFETGLDERALEGAWKALERGLIIRDGWVWVRRFLRHQKNDALNPENRAHKQIIALLGDQTKRFGDHPEFPHFEAPSKPLPRGLGTVQVQDKKEEVQEKPSKSASRASEKECIAYAVERGLPVSDGEHFFNSMEGGGWTRGGKPVKDWKACFRTWETGQYLPSLKARQGLNGHSKPSYESIPFNKPPEEPQWIKDERATKQS